MVFFVLFCFWNYFKWENKKEEIDGDKTVQIEIHRRQGNEKETKCMIKNKNFFFWKTYFCAS